MRKLVLLMLFTLILAGCSEEYNYETEGPFIIVTTSPAGPDDYRNFFPRNISIHSDGTLRIYTESFGELIIGKDAPIFVTQLEEEQVETIKELIEKHNFLKLEENLEDPAVMDGGYEYITVVLSDTSKKVGGLNPNHEALSEIIDYVYELVDNDSYNYWRQQVKEYIYERYPD